MADLTLPDTVRGCVIFAHGSGSGRHSPRNQTVARTLHAHRLATLLADLLTSDEEALDRLEGGGRFRFDIPLLGRRVVALVDWARQDSRLRSLPIGLFGASTGAAAALVAAAARPADVSALVSRGGRPDLAGDDVLSTVTAPTLLIVGSRDPVVLKLNEAAAAEMRGHALIEVVAGATHLFEEPGTLEHVAVLASSWFDRHL